MRPQRTISKKWVLTGLCLGSFALVLLPQDISRWPNRLLRPVVMLAAGPGKNLAERLRGQFEAAVSPKETDPQIPALISQAAYLRQTIENQQKSIEGLTKHRAVLGGFPCRLIEGRIVAGESIPLRNRGLVNVGKTKGAQVGDLATTRHILHDMDVGLDNPQLAVLGQSFVVGRLLDCSAYNATLQLVTDRNFKVPARVYRIVQPGQQREVLMQGPAGTPAKKTVRNDTQKPDVVGQPLDVQAEGDGSQIVVRHVPGEYGLQPGDMLKTGPSDFLPVDLAIGTVKRVEREKDSAHFTVAYVEPLADLAGLDEVFIVLPYR